jgi:hypothetical protein
VPAKTGFHPHSLSKRLASIHGGMPLRTFGQQRSDRSVSSARNVS